MNPLEPFLALISFLTILPVSRSYNLDYIARYMFLFPLVGLLIGFIVGFIAYLLYSITYSSLIVALIATATLLIITGMHHTDALADFADGIMAKGSRDVKLRALRDPAIGSAGATALILYIVGLIIALASIDNSSIVSALIVSEVIAKYAMVLQASIGRVAWEGMGASFARSMSIKDNGGSRWIASTVITLLLVYILSKDMGIYAFIASVASALVMLLLAYRNFGGISGDLFGATNELTRLVSLLVFAVLI